VTLFVLMLLNTSLRYLTLPLVVEQRAPQHIGSPVIEVVPQYDQPQSWQRPPALRSTPPTGEYGYTTSCTYHQPVDSFERTPHSSRVARPSSRDRVVEERSAYPYPVPQQLVEAAPHPMYHHPARERQPSVIPPMGLHELYPRRQSPSDRRFMTPPGAPMRWEGAPMRSEGGPDRGASLYPERW
jgi:hypothetical protein